MGWMMELSGKKRLLIFATASVLLLFYQNCAENFKSVQTASVQESNEGAGAVNNPPASTPPSPTPPATSSPTPLPPPIVQPTPIPTPIPTPMTPPAGRVNVFMASGHMGRTVFSCDDGMTWIRDQSQNDNARCWVDGNPNYVECDHTPYSGVGLDANDGWFFANFGWGFNGSVRRSRDGVNWQTMRSDGWGGGVGYADGVLLLLWSGGRLSNDEGATWLPQSNPRIMDGFEHPKLKRLGNKFVLIGRPSGTNKVGISLDQGTTWFRPASLQVDWLKKVEEGNNRMVFIGYSSAGNTVVSYSAVSMDQGRTWTIHQQTNLGVRWETIIFDGQRFVAWGSGRRLTSTDGVTWTSTNMVVEGFNAEFFEGPTSYNPVTGTYVRILGVWGNYYDRQKAYRSSDGITWIRRPDTAFRGGHPINDLVLGTMDQAACR